MANPTNLKEANQLRIAVVGPCASGKTTLVRGLRKRGFDAYVVAQEHSAVPGLWAHQHPDLLIALHADLETIRKRRGPAWSGVIYQAQLERLQQAYEAADLTIDTSSVRQKAAIAESVKFLETYVTTGNC
jgi:deoxyadenosine/deoxycytidine kinase